MCEKASYGFAWHSRGAAGDEIMRAKPKDPRSYLAFAVGRRFLGAKVAARAGEAMEEHEGGEAKQDEYWAVSFGFSSAVGTDLGKKASGSRGGGSRAAGAEECVGGCQWSEPREVNG